jgi:hypothetical protein
LLSQCESEQEDCKTKVGEKDKEEAKEDLFPEFWMSDEETEAKDGIE